MREDDNCEEYEENQGKRIVHPSCISDKMANLFYARFWGRMDVYAKRYEKRYEEDGVLSTMLQFLERCLSEKIWS